MSVLYVKSSGVFEPVVAGAPGASGATGPAGPAGATGPTGAGVTGASGPSGPLGLPGTPGATGVTGPAGTPGVTGPAGATGATGPAGTTGTTGPAGTAGASGAQGAVGPAGTTGATGVTGATGPAGVTGATGVSGVVGATGVTGATGPAGSGGGSGTQYTAVKTSQENRANTTSFTADSQLFVSPTVAGTYLISALFDVYPGSTTVGFRFRIHSTSGNSGSVSAMTAWNGSISSNQYGTANIETGIGFGGGGDHLFVTVIGYITIGGSDTVQVLWTQNTSGGNGTGMYPGSFLTLTKVS